MSSNYYTHKDDLRLQKMNEPKHNSKKRCDYGSNKISNKIGTKMKKKLFCQQCNER